MRRGPRKLAEQDPHARINSAISAREVRVVGAEGENLGILPIVTAIEKARSLGLDLIEISANAHPPIAKIMDYGKYVYEEKKKIKERKSKSHLTETKSIQVKIGTGEHDLELKAKKASEWLSSGHRVKVELYLSGRAKFLDPNFLSERLTRFTKLLSVNFKIASGPEKGPKGLFITLERA